MEILSCGPLFIVVQHSLLSFFHKNIIEYFDITNLLVIFSCSNGTSLPLITLIFVFLANKNIPQALSYLILVYCAMHVRFLNRFELSVGVFIIWSCITRLTSILEEPFSTEDYSIEKSKLFVQIALVSVIGGCFATWFVCSTLSTLTTFRSNWRWKLSIMVAMVSVIVCVVDATNMINWLLYFVFYSHNGLIAKVCGCWSVLIFIFIYVSTYLNSIQRLRKTIIRKFFHLLALVLFAPALLVESLHSFLILSIGLVLSLFILLEFLRLYIFQDLQDFDCQNSCLSTISCFFVSFAHSSELIARHGVVLSHISLLGGCYYPIYLYRDISCEFHDSSRSQFSGFIVRLLPYLGIVTVCVGDSLASVCGSLWGKMKWQSTGTRTVLGSVAALVGILTSSILILSAEYVANYSKTTLTLTSLDVSLTFFIIVTVSGVTTFVEAFATENDNLLLPYCACCTFLLLFCIFL